MARSPGAGSHVEYALGSRAAHDADYAPPPQTVDVERQHVVEPVVGRCDVVEHQFDAGRVWW